MKLNQIIEGLTNLNEDDLVALNRAVCDQIKAQRNIEAAMKRHLFAIGDKVKWDGRRGPAEGKILKVNRKKAIVEVNFQRWNIPLSMLEMA